MYTIITEIIVAIGGYLAGKAIRDPGAKLEDVKKELSAFSDKYNADAEKVKAGIIQLDEAVRNHAAHLERIQKDLTGIQTEFRAISEIAIRRTYWNYGATAVACIALIIAIVSLARKT